MEKIAFFDIDGVLTPTSDFTAGTSPKLTSGSLKILKKYQKKGFYTIFITARSIIELRFKNGFENNLKEKGLLKKSLVFGSGGLDEATYGLEFKTKNGKIVYKDGNAILVKKQIIKRESFSHIDQYLLFKMLLGKEIKQQLKYAGFKIKPAISNRMINDARIFFQLENKTKTNTKLAIEKTKEIIKEQREIFKRTKKFGSPVELVVYDADDGFSIEPIDLGKHLAALRALRRLSIKTNEKIIGYAFGDRDSDKKMKIRKDITFVKVKNNKDFIKKSEEILKNY